ncbi:unnamed protein product, partial [Scytosiphon promiscuus]
MPVAVYGEHRPQEDRAWSRSGDPAEPSNLGYQHRRDLHDGRGQGTPQLESIKPGPAAQEDPGINGYRSRIFEGGGSPSSSRPLPTAGPPPMPPESRQLPVGRFAAPPPEPGQHPSFDAKVAAEFFRMREAKAPFRDGTGTDSSGGRAGRPGGASPPPPPPPQARAFESDVERAMKDIETRLAATGGGGGAQGTDPSPSPFHAADESRGSRLSPPSSPGPSPAPADHRRAVGGDGSMLSQMDM